MRLVLLLTSLTAAMAASTGNGFATTFSQGNGQGYAYGGSFGGGGGGAGGSFPPRGAFPAGVPPFDFNGLFSQYFDVFKQFSEELTNNELSAYAYSVTNVDSNSRAQAQSSLTFEGQGLQSQQNALVPGGSEFSGGYPAYSGGGYGGGYSSYGGGFGGQGASASASLGPGGAHQTAGVYPQNPNIPNIDRRFGSSGGGSYSVFTSSQSSNVNGKPYHQASTTINDNGKVTTYNVHNP